MSTPPVVTVIIPTYNQAHFLRDALQSLCAQTFTNWEAIVINNFSVDETVAVVDSFADSRIQLENFRNNGIIAASRNRGIALARGKYIAFLDSDDTWYPNKLAKCLEQFDDDIGLVCHGLRWFGDQEKDIFCGPKERATFDRLLNEGNCITTSATVVCKDMVEMVGCFSEDPTIVTSEDYHLWIKFARANIGMRFIKEILGQYRVHSESQSSSVLRHLNSVLCVVNEFFPEKKSRNFKIRMRLRRRFAIAYYSAGRAMQRNGQYTQSWRLLFRAIGHSPFFVKSYIAILLGFIGIIKFWRR